MPEGPHMRAFFYSEKDWNEFSRNKAVLYPFFSP
ncbi:hypothetical protein EIO60_02904|nr:hypothetical protein [Candidatus Pantoea persica]